MELIAIFALLLALIGTKLLEGSPSNTILDDGDHLAGKS